MANTRQALYRRRLFWAFAIPALLFGLAMLHPYPRQSLCGPKIDGEPWCVWESEFRDLVHWDDKDAHFITKARRWMGWHVERPFDLKFRVAAAEPLLLNLAEDKDPLIREHAVYRLIRGSGFRNRAALPFIRPQIMDKDPHMRMQTAVAIWRIERDRKIIPVLQRELDDRAGEHRASAASYLAEMYELEPDDDLLAILQRYRNHPLPAVRCAVLRAAHREKNGLPELVNALKDTDKDVRRCAAYYLGILRSVALDALPELEACLRDEDKSVREAAKTAIMYIGWRRYVELGFE